MTASVRAGEYSGSPGGDCIQRAIDDAAASAGQAVVTVGPDGPDEDGRWALEDAIELPSHTTLRLEGAHLRLVDGANDNVLRNRDLESGNEAIHVVGDGTARIDGNAVNQERDWSRLYDSYGVHFFDVDSLSIRGVRIGPTECWALTVEDVRDVQISDIEFAQDGTTPNQDGLHLLGPAQRITVDGITGTCGDDVVAIDSSESDPYGRGSDGAIQAVSVTNVAIENVFSTGLFRTIAERDAPVEGVFASNLSMTGGTDVGDAALKIGWADDGVEELPRPEDHQNITIENVFVEEWDAPYCVVQAPVKNFTLRGARGSHTGPFFYNHENDLKNVCLEDCKTTLSGSPPATLVNDYHQNSLDGERFRGAVTDDPPGVLTFDNARCRGVQIQDCAFETACEDSSGSSGLRVYADTECESLSVRDTSFQGFERGVVIDDDASVSALGFESVLQRDVAEPWCLEKSARSWGCDPAF